MGRSGRTITSICCRRRAKAKTIGFVIQDTLHAKEVGSGAVPRARDIGLEVVFEETVQANTTDFTPIITKLKTANPDIIYVSAFPPFAIGFYKQALELGLNPREYHIIHHGAAFRNAVGEANANYVTGENYWMPGITYGMPEVFEEVLKRTGIRLEDYPWASIHMFAFEAIQAAVEQAESLAASGLAERLEGAGYHHHRRALALRSQDRPGHPQPLPNPDSARQIRHAVAARDRHGLPYLSAPGEVIAHDGSADPGAHRWSAAGGMYALGAFGLSLVFGVLGILNVTHGDFLMLGWPAVLWRLCGVGLGSAVSLVIVIPVFFGVGCLFERVLIQPLLAKSPHELLMGSILVTLGAALAIEDLVPFVWTQSFSGIPYTVRSLVIGDVVIPTLRLAILLGIVVLTLLLHVFLRHTFVGIALRAMTAESARGDAGGDQSPTSVDAGLRHRHGAGGHGRGGPCDALQYHPHDGHSAHPEVSDHRRPGWLGESAGVGLRRHGARPLRGLDQPLYRARMGANRGLHRAHRRPGGTAAGLIRRAAAVTCRAPARIQTRHPSCSSSACSSAWPSASCRLRWGGTW